jgi:ATP-binding cassette subfamily B protein
VSLFKKKKNKIDPSEATRVIRRMLSGNGSQYKASYAIAIAASLIVGVSNGALAYLMKPMIDKIFYEQKIGLIWVICGAILGIFVLRGLSSYVQAVELAKIGNNLVARYQKRIFDHLLKLGLDFYNDTRSGHLAAQINQNVNGIRDLLNMTITSIARDFVALIGLSATCAGGCLYFAPYPVRHARSGASQFPSSGRNAGNCAGHFHCESLHHGRSAPRQDQHADRSG